MFGDVCILHNRAVLSEQFVSSVEYLYKTCVKSTQWIPEKVDQYAQLSQRDRTAGCVIVSAKSGRLELEDNTLQKL